MKSTNNNFNLIRLFAAMQVAIVHSAGYLNIDIQYLKFLDLLPGVPIFFFISGYLIIKSFRNNYKLKNFFYNRILRIYPGLYFCFFITVISIIISQYLKNIDYYLLRKAKQTIFAGIVQDYVEGYTRRGKYFFGDVGDGPSARCH